MKKSYDIKIVQAVSAGQLGSILSLGTKKLSQKKLKKLKKRLKASENWTFDDNTLRSCSGASVPGYAEWCGIVAVNLKGTVHRFRILAVYYNEEMWYFALPIRMLRSSESIKELPGIEFGPEEIRLLFAMADELRKSKSDREMIITLKHPLMETLRVNIKKYLNDDETLPDRLLQLLQSVPVVLHIMIAAFDMQLRVTETMEHAPFSLYNFTPSSHDLQAPDRIISLFTALNFTTCSDTSEPILSSLKEENDLQNWYMHIDRMTILRTTRTGLLRPILDDISDRDQAQKSGCLMPALLPSTPIVISAKYVHNPVALDTCIEKDAADLTAEEMDLLRNAMARALHRANPRSMLQKLKSQMASKEGYRLNPRAVWRNILAEELLKSISFEEEFLEKALGLMKNAESELEEARRERSASIQRAMDFLKDPERYIEQIIARPATKEVAVEALSGKALAFRFIPAKGPDAGTEYLAFSKESLSRLLKQTGGSEEIFDAFLDECERENVLDNRNRVIKFGEQTLRLTTFRLDF